PITGKSTIIITHTAFGSTRIRRLSVMIASTSEYTVKATTSRIPAAISKFRIRVKLSAPNYEHAQHSPDTCHQRRRPPVSSRLIGSISTIILMSVESSASSESSENPHDFSTEPSSHSSTSGSEEHAAYPQPAERPSTGRIWFFVLL